MNSRLERCANGVRPAPELRRHLHEIRQQHTRGQSRRVARLGIAKRFGQQRDARAQHLYLRLARLDGRLCPGALHGEALEQVRQIIGGQPSGHVKDCNRGGRL